MTPKLRAFAVSLGAFLLADQALKLWTVHALRYRGRPLEPATQAALDALGHSTGHPSEAVLIPNLLSLVHAQNPAAAMGMMIGVEHRMLVFAVFTVVAVASLVAMLRALPREDRVQSAAIGIILSGAIGNAIDRVHKSTVTDMIKVHWGWEPGRSWLEQRFGTSEWFTFNIADAAIFIGVGLYVLYQATRRDAAEAEDVGAPPPLESTP